ncbi:hypothetical protein [Pseudomonas capsici]|uniref:hypothetical protein n=1 Tax=Pseudomonas capsici TaxID=2810614 RepID=UPI0019107C6E|nr:hypothetical protein [Pseudomonas capsici]MBX8607608.1 hypothetical protein [Pseudomonas cichorii]
MLTLIFAKLLFIKLSVMFFRCGHAKAEGFIFLSSRLAHRHIGPPGLKLDQKVKKRCEKISGMQRWQGLLQENRGFRKGIKRAIARALRPVNRKSLR